MRPESVLFAWVLASLGIQNALGVCVRGTQDENCMISSVVDGQAYCTPVGCDPICSTEYVASDPNAGPCPPPSAPPPPPASSTDTKDADETGLVVAAVILGVLAALSIALVVALWRENSVEFARD